MSVHLVRRAATNDTAFTHKIEEVLNDGDSSDSDNEAPETKNQYFEFSNSYFVIRFIKMVFVVQVLSLVIDHPQLKLTVLFDMCCRGILYYSIRFCSRPFLDILYVLQYFWHQMLAAIQSQNVSSTPTVHVTARRLNHNPYVSFFFRVQVRYIFCSLNHSYIFIHSPLLDCYLFF
jgi:hypothetical protein